MNQLAFYLFVAVLGVGKFLSNLIMGVLFSFSQSIPYFYAFASALLATMVLGAADVRYGRPVRPG